MKRKIQLSNKEIILIVLFVLMGGAQGAKVILSLAKSYLKKRSYYSSYELNEEKFRSVLSRLKKSRLVENPNRGLWNISRKGKEAARNILKRNVYEEFKRSNKKFDTIIIFDIPEMHKKKRNYLRLELVALGFVRLQKSVWIGGSPLPKEFIEYLKEMKLLSYVHIFSIKDPGTMIPEELRRVFW